jgi:hypothetical protein
MARENSSHAPGADIDEGIRQHQTNARGEGPIKGESFGVGEATDIGQGGYPGTRRIKGDVEMMAKELADTERGVGKTVPLGGGYMDASRNPDHGPHGHKKREFELAGRKGY